MTRKHFEAFAKAVARIADNDERKRTALLVANVCERFNASFSREAFFAACKVVAL